MFATVAVHASTTLLKENSMRRLSQKWSNARQFGSAVKDTVSTRISESKAKRNPEIQQILRRLEKLSGDYQFQKAAFPRELMQLSDAYCAEWLGRVDKRSRAYVEGVIADVRARYPTRTVRLSVNGNFARVEFDARGESGFMNQKRAGSLLHVAIVLHDAYGAACIAELDGFAELT
jgi:hypothetical protein